MKKILPSDNFVLSLISLGMIYSFLFLASAIKTQYIDDDVPDTPLVAKSCNKKVMDSVFENCRRNIVDKTYEIYKANRNIVNSYCDGMASQIACEEIETIKVAMEGKQ